MDGSQHLLATGSTRRQCVNSWLLPCRSIYKTRDSKRVNERDTKYARESTWFRILCRGRNNPPRLIPRWISIKNRSEFVTL